MEGARYLEDGKLTVFRRAGIYYARIRISLRKYIWRSLKTSNEQTAVDLGRRLLFQWNREPKRDFRQNPNYSQPSKSLQGRLNIPGFIPGRLARSVCSRCS